MRKRVGIARAIAGSPKYLLYDEPTSGLDPVNADIIDSLVQRLDDELGVTSVMVTHDVRGAFRVADRLALLSEGTDRDAGHPAGVPRLDEPRRSGSSSSATSTTPRSRPEPIMDLRYSREVTVGAIVIVAVLVFVFGTMWLSGRSVESGNLVRMQFPNVSGLKRASPVRVSGVNVGKVERIEFVDVGKVLVTASLPPKIRPKVDASAKIVSVTLVGDYAVDFDPGRSTQLLPPGTVILGTQDLGLSGRALQLSDRADSLLIGAQAIVNERTADQLRSTLTALEGTLKAAQRTMQIYGDPEKGPTAELTRTMAAFRQLGTRLDSTLASPAFSSGRAPIRSPRNLAAMTSQLAATGERLDTLLAGMNRGRARWANSPPTAGSTTTSGS